MKNKGYANQADSFLFGSGGPQSDAHEPRFQSVKSKVKNEKKEENSKNKEKG